MAVKKARKVLLSNEMKTREVILPLYKIFHMLVLIIMCSSGLQDTGCGGLTLDGCQLPTKLFYQSLPQQGTVGRK